MTRGACTLAPGAAAPAVVSRVRAARAILGALLVLAGVLVAGGRARAVDEGERDRATQRCRESIDQLLQIVKKADAPLDVASADRACEDARRSAGERELPVSPALAALADSLASLANVAASIDDLEIAERAIVTAVELSDRVALAPAARAGHLVSLARIRGQRGDPASEEDGMLRALAIAEQDPDPVHAAEVCRAAGDMYERRQEYASAERFQSRRVELLERRIEFTRRPLEPGESRVVPAIENLEEDVTVAKDDVRRVRACGKAAARGKRAPLECCIRTGLCAVR